MKKWLVPALDRSRQSEIQQRLNDKTKPLGSLGELENLAMQLALIQGVDRIVLRKPTVLVFAADHGIARHNISIAPQAVTQQMVRNFLSGGAAINCFCRVNEVELRVVDCGMLAQLDFAHPQLTVSRIANGTQDFSQHAAMTLGQAQASLIAGANIALKQIDAGVNVLGFGEMGIGNSSSAAAILAGLSGVEVARCVGRGTGINDEQLQQKIDLITQGVARLNSKEPMQLLAQVGGFEIGQMCGAMLAAASRKVVIVVDGFIVTAAAMLAVAIAPESRDYMIFAHKSDEQAHQLMLEQLRAKPLLSLGLRLGEGTGAALVMPFLKAAASFYNDMATFSQANVTDVS